MKKYIIKFLFAGLLCVVFASCKKDFLDLKPYDQVSSENAIKDEAGMQAALNGTYAQLRSINLFGRAIPLVGDLMADNVYIATVNSNRFIGEFNYVFNNNFGQSLNTWSDGYVAILRANNIINSPLTANTNVNQMKGEAYAMRALVYFYLVNLFGKPFTVDAASPGVPIVLAYDPNEKPARKKVSEVYQQIDADLAAAFNLISSTTKNSSYVTKYAVRALQAKVALFKGDWAAAKTAALDVVNNGGYTLAASTNYVAYWNNPAPITTKVETIFEVSFDGISNAGINSLAYFYDPSGYGDAVCSDELYNTYSATDIRRSLIVPGVRGTQNVKIVNKYRNNTNNADKDDVKIIRYAEILLILAEAYARTSEEANALIRLNQVATIRDPSFAGYASTGAALLNDIINERRKELAFEGDRYWDLTRRNVDVVRVNLNNNYPASTPLSLPASSHKRIWPIHQTELDANKNIQQNPNY
jgi:starch-binding outer membrane protein, SusD/RagB family